MENIDLIVKIALDIIVLVTFTWTMWQEWRLRRKIGYGEMLNTKDLEDLAMIMDRLNADIKELKAQMTSTKANVFDYVDSQLKPIARRLSTRASREKEAQEQLNEKKGGIIPFPQQNGTTQQTQFNV